jgi:putative flippase GtrA
VLSELGGIVASLSRSKVVRFGLVGLANSAIDLAVFAVAIWLGTPALIANFLGWLVAVSFSYFANSRWSFERDPTLGDARSALRFISLGALITLGVSSGAILALAGWIGVMPAKIVGLVIAAVISFVAARWSIENRVL